MINDPAGCWCARVVIPPDLLELAPDGKTCICARCVEAYGEDPESFVAGLVGKRIV